MKLLKLSDPVLELDGTEIPNATLGTVLANALVQSRAGDPIKYFDWAWALKHQGTITVDQSDFETLKAFVSGGESQIPNLARGPILKAMLAAQSPPPPTPA